jgi:hypothetical protein
MSRFRIVDVRIWHDEKFLGISRNARLLFLYLLTSPETTAIGCLKASPMVLAEALAMPFKELQKCFSELLEIGCIEYDEKRLVVLTNWFKYNRPSCPNQMTAWVKCLDMLPECETKVLVEQRLKSFANTLGNAFADAFDKAFGKVSAIPLAKECLIQDQDQEQDQEQDLRDQIREETIHGIEQAILSKLQVKSSQRIIRQIAWCVAAGLLSEASVFGAANGVRTVATRPKSPVAYFVKILKNEIKNFDALIAKAPR